MAKEKDMVNHPPHYAEATSMECIDAMVVALGVDAVMHFCLGNAYKYLWRHKFKGGVQDLDKADWYLDKYLTLYECNAMAGDCLYTRLRKLSYKFRGELEDVISED